MIYEYLHIPVLFAIINGLILRKLTVVCLAATMAPCCETAGKLETAGIMLSGLKVFL